MWHVHRPRPGSAGSTIGTNVLFSTFAIRERVRRTYVRENKSHARGFRGRYVNPVEEFNENRFRGCRSRLLSEYFDHPHGAYLLGLRRNRSMSSTLLVPPEVGNPSSKSGRCRTPAREKVTILEPFPGNRNTLAFEPNTIICKVTGRRRPRGSEGR